MTVGPSCDRQRLRKAANLNIRKSYSANSVSTFEQISRKQRYKPDLQDLSPGAYSEYLKASQGHS